MDIHLPPTDSENLALQKALIKFKEKQFPQISNVDLGVKPYSGSRGLFGNNFNSDIIQLLFACGIGLYVLYLIITRT